MKKPKIVVVFKVKVNYKSGISEVFECTKFVVKTNNSMEWTVYPSKKRPIDIAVNGTADIESVWQIGSRRAVVWQ
jgi:hypothetical protein